MEVRGRIANKIVAYCQQNPEARNFEVSDALGVSRTYVAAVRYRYDCQARFDAEGAAAHKSRTKDIMLQLTPEVAEWLRLETPEGSTPNEIIIAIINDAYAEAEDRLG